MAKMSHQKKIYAAVLSSDETPAPTSDPVSYLDMLITALQRPEEITFANTFTEPSVDIHAMVVNAVMNRILPDSIRGNQKSLACWDTYSMVVVDHGIQCSSFGFQDGEIAMLKHLNPASLGNLDLTEIQISNDDQRIWGGGYLVEVKGGLARITVPSQGESIFPVMLAKDRLNLRSRVTGRFCTQTYQPFRGSGVRCGL
jgi:hypothetical protein